MLKFLNQERDNHMPESPHGGDSQWAVYEASVQAYRGLSLSSQSLFLAVGAILLSLEIPVPFFTVMALALASTWYVWFPLIFARTAIVDYHKFQLAKRFDQDGNLFSVSLRDDSNYFLREKDYAATGNRVLRGRVYNGLTESGGPRFRTMRMTRKKIDLYLPIFFTIVWTIFAGYVISIRL
jgi:hypothetical protein